jgi:uncharacterized protein YxjI
MFNNLSFPLNFKFKITTLSNDFVISDNLENTIGYVRSKIFKLKDDVLVYTNESKTKELYRIKANQWIDFNASYTINDLANNTKIGRLSRKGMRSFWRASYEIYDQDENKKFHISEKNPWVKIWDSIFNDIPVIGVFTGYVFNPSYVVKDNNGKEIFELKKMPSLFGRRFQLNRIAMTNSQDETNIVLSLMMMVLLERNRG